jgi:hypothetical protein
MFLFFVALVVFLAIWFWLASTCSNVARKKGRSSFGWYCIGLISGPVGLMLALIVNPTPGFHVPEERPCPYCAESVRFEAIVCKHCHRDIPRAERPVVVTPEVSGKVPLAYRSWIALVTLFVLFIFIISFY